jgi:acyl transferase domain-containing protein/NADPH:quinone reductase-like Zn-dependent oxidoreductase
VSENDQLLIHLRRATAELRRLRQRLADAEARRYEPIAVTGMSCRFPGARTPEGLWNLLASGRDAIGPLPADRGWDLGQLHHPDPDHPGTSHVNAGGFLPDVPEFDPGFFGITPREAVAMDPQQRIMLELAWEAIGDAGIGQETLRGSSTGVYVGAWQSGYGAGHRALDDLEGYLVTGAITSVLAGRISYLLGLQGPSLSVETACSSSLVAIHLACQALRAGECALAIAGGVTVMATPDLLVEFSRQRGLAADGICKPFATAADGMAVSEGAGLLLLERLEDAERHDRHVLSVIRGSAVNQDGASNGLTAPSRAAQEEVIERALAAAGLSPDDIDAVEAHGTGTPLGDPIEAAALLSVYGRTRPPGRPLHLGSVKSNIGHTQAAAGVAGAIKMIMAMGQGRLPATLHVDQPSPEIDWSSGALSLLTVPVPWPQTGRPRRAAVSSFGVSGTNAHLVLEQPATSRARPPRATRPSGTAGTAGEAGPLLMSAADPAGLRARAAELAERLAADPATRAADVLPPPAADHAYRAAVLGGDRERLLQGLAVLAKGERGDSVLSGTAQTAQCVFVFPGQGAQWAGMGTALLDTVPAFAGYVAECDAVLARLTGWSVERVLRGAAGAPPLERVDVVQPVLFTVTTSLARLWQACGVRPGAVIGHSQGEVAAAYVCGALTLDDACRVVALRSRALTGLAGTGGMAVLRTPELKAARLLAGLDGRIEIAAVNGPCSTVVAGPADALSELLAVCERADIDAQRIAVDYASHCAAIDVVRDGLLDALTGIVPRPSAVPFYSSVTAASFDTTALTADYWFRNLRGPVRFAAAVRAALADGHRLFVEAAPHPLLTGAITEIAEAVGVDAAAVGSLRRGDGGPATFAASAAAAHVRGATVDLSVLCGGPLRPYGPRRSRHWLDPATVPAVPSGQVSTGHPLLGSQIDLPGDRGLILAGEVSLRAQPWLSGHAIEGTALVPGAAFADLALLAADRLSLGSVAELTSLAPLILPPADAVQLRLTTGPGWTFTIHGRHPSPGAPWVAYASGVLAEAAHPPSRQAVAWPSPRAEVPGAEVYDLLAGLGYRYDGPFRALRMAWRDGDTLYAELDPLAEPAAGFAVPPPLLDSALHALGLGLLETDGRPAVPHTWRGMTLHGPAATIRKVRLRRTGEATVSLSLTDSAGRPVLTVQSLTLSPLTPRDPLDSPAGGLYRLIWERLPREAAEPTPPGPVLLMGAPPPGVLIKSLEQAGTVHTSATARGPGGYRHAVYWAGGGEETEAGGGEQVGSARERVLDLIRCIRELVDGEGIAPRLWIVTSGVHRVAAGDRIALTGAGLRGVAAVAASEHPELRVVELDLDDPAELAAELAHSCAESLIAIRAGVRFVGRLAPAPITEPEQDAASNGTVDYARNLVRLVPGDPPDLDALRQMAGRREPPGPGRVELRVQAAGLCFPDLLAAAGLASPAGGLGLECAGTVTAVGPDVTHVRPGDLVMALAPDAAASFTTTAADLVAHVPDGMAAETAAGQPLAYTTAWYALRKLAGAAPGDRVLIHSAGGGVGLAAVRVAGLLGVEVLAAAGTDARRRLLRALGVRTVLDSRVAEFAGTVREATGGEGVDIVLNTRTGPGVAESVACLRPGGRFVELGRRGLPGEVPAGITAIGFDLVRQIHDGGSRVLAQALAEAAAELAAGRLVPLPCTSYPLARAARALRAMSASRQVGKLVLTVPERGRTSALLPGGRHPFVVPDGAYVVTGGLRGLGAKTARLLLERGAARVVVNARNGTWEGPADSRVRVVLGDVAAPGIAERLIAAAVADGLPLRGVVHSAMVLLDAPIGTITADLLDRVWRPKAEGAWRLHEAVAGRELHWFVTYSSMSSLVGAPGQAAYAGRQRLARRVRRLAAGARTALAQHQLGCVGRYRRIRRVRPLEHR